MLTARKAMRALKAILPSWMLPIFAVCLVIPGPFDEAAMVLVALAMVVVQPVRARRAVAAWRGGKSHRRHDAGRVVVTFGPVNVDVAMCSQCGSVANVWTAGDCDDCGGSYGETSLPLSLVPTYAR